MIYINKKGGNCTINKQQNISYLSSELSTYKSILKSMPPGKLLCEKNGKHSKWYITNGHTRKYLPKSEFELASKLAFKKYLELKTNLLSFQLSTFTSAATKQHKLETQLVNYISNPLYQPLLAPYLSLKDSNQIAWEKADYPTNPNHPENLVHPTIGGIKVRSKSESLIALSLYQYQIPFRYECHLQLGLLSIYPDFTILHPTTNQLIYWEHFGLMDNPRYANDSISKLNTYATHSIIPGINLITSYETSSVPLSYDTIDKLIHIYLL